MPVPISWNPKIGVVVLNPKSGNNEADYYITLGLVIDDVGYSYSVRAARNPYADPILTLWSAQPLTQADYPAFGKRIEKLFPKDRVFVDFVKPQEDL